MNNKFNFDFKAFDRNGKKLIGEYHWVLSHKEFAEKLGELYGVHPAFVRHKALIQFI